MHKALEDESLLAWAINGQPLADLHGFPLRLVFGGWPGSASGKWARRILIRDRVHDGEKMLGQSYRAPCEPVAPGEDVPDEQMCFIHSMPVKSMVTSPMSEVEHPIGELSPLVATTSLGGRGRCLRTFPTHDRAWMESSRAPEQRLPPHRGSCDLNSTDCVGSSSAYRDTQTVKRSFISSPLSLHHSQSLFTARTVCSGVLGMCGRISMPVSKCVVTRASADLRAGL